MSATGRRFLDDSRAFLRDDYWPRLERCVAHMSDEDLWWRPNAWSNSAGNLLLHLNGSTAMWVLAVAGGRRIERDRQSEFDERGPIPREELLARLRATLEQVDEVLARLDPEVLLERRRRGEDEVTVMWAVAHAVEHFSMHAGQIILLAKLRAGEAFELPD